MRTAYCISTLKKIRPYDLQVEKVNVPAYCKPYVLQVQGGDERAIEEAYHRAVKLTAKEVGNSDSILIVLENGEYRFNHTVRLDKKTESGLPIVMRSSGKTALLASVRLRDGWQPYKNGVYKTRVDTDKFRQLYVNGKLAVRARFPKKNDDCEKEVFEGKWLDKTKQILLPHEFDCVMNEFDASTAELHIFEAWTHSVIKPGNITSEKNGIVVDLDDICRDRFYEPRSSKIAKPKVWLEMSSRF